MNLYNIVGELLQLHDCVVIPDLGGFISNYCPAKVDSERNIFTPPGKEIVFNGKLIKNDGLLVNAIMDRKKISYSNARLLIAEFVEEVYLKMENGEKVLLPHVGSLFFDKGLNIQFEPEINKPFSADSFGLDTFQYDPVDNTDILPKFDHINTPEKLKVPISRKVIKRVAVSVPLIALLMMAPLYSRLPQPFYQSEANTFSINNNFKARNVVMEAPALAEDSVLIAEEINEGTVIEIAPDEEEKTTPIKIQPIKNNGKYYLVVGSFQSRENALKLCDIYINKYFEPEILEEDGLYRVSLNSFDDRKSAMDVIQIIQKNDSEIPVWLYFKK